MTFTDLFSSVSIPHRFNSHNCTSKAVRGISRFQSLTGSIHTSFLIRIRNRPKKSFNPSQVQFTLISKGFIEKEVLKFQSLTGSIHT